MKHIDLFSGIGGFSLACEWAGIETICFVEIDKFCQKVLKKHWPDVLICEDINNVEEIVTHATKFRDSGSSLSGSDREYQELQGEIGGSDRQPNNAKLLLTAGFPCQPFSNAGRKRGSSDDRYLWPQTLAVIEAVKPDWIILENVPGILNMVFPDSEVGVASQSTLFGVENDEICDYSTISGGIERDLRQTGYETVWLVIPTCSLGAPHRRDRVWIVANATNNGCNWNDTRSNLERWFTTDKEQSRSGRSSGNQGCDSHAADTSGTGLEIRSGQHDRPGTIRQERETISQVNTIPGWSENWYEVATRFCRVDDGLPRVMDRVDRLKALGNAIVPQVAYQIIKAIQEAE